MNKYIRKLNSERMLMIIQEATEIKHYTILFINITTIGQRNLA